jgi:hypothetical protein
MANPSVDPLAVTSEEDGENVNIKQSRTTISKTDSFESTKLLSTPVTISSTGKESSYDILSAPSPPPSREIPQQVIITIDIIAFVLSLRKPLNYALDETRTRWTWKSSYEKECSPN